jgi:YfiH family protein
MSDFRLVARGGIKWLECIPLAGLPWLVHGFSTRVLEDGRNHRAAGEDGFNLGRVAWDDPGRVERNRRRFTDEIGANEFAVASLRQVHSADVYVTSAGGNGAGHPAVKYRPAGGLYTAGSRFSPDVATATADEHAIQAGDALITREPRLLLTVRTADCVSVLLADAEAGAIAAVHAGWRGALNRIIEKAVGDLRRVFNSRPQDLIAAVGPSIRACCYEVGQEVVDAFCGSFPNPGRLFREAPANHEQTALKLRYPLLFLNAKPPGHGADDGGRAQPALHLDLTAVAREQLESAGVSHIYVADYCTAGRTDLFYSHRKEGVRAGRMMAAIGIRPVR